MLRRFENGGEPADDVVLSAMFEARKRVFVDLLRWDVPVIDGRFEIDQFDDAAACYIVMTDRAGEHLASTRLLATTGAHILGDLYPMLCEDAAPRGPAILEITRFCIDRRLRARERLNVRNMLVSALVDHALATGIARYTGVAEIGWLQQILAFGWRCRPLGLPQLIDGKLLGALSIEITDDTPSLLMCSGIYPAAALAVEHRHAA